MDNDILVVQRAAIITHEGRTILLRPRTTVRAGHPITAGREDLFAPITVDYDLEAATETADADLLGTRTADAPPATPKASRKTETR